MTPADFKAALKGLGMTQAEFAEYVGQNLRTINDWGSETPKNAGRNKGDVRIGPPSYIIRLIRNMERNYIPRAPISPTVQQTVEAISKALGAVVGNAAAKEWPGSMVAEAVGILANHYAAQANNKPELSAAIRRLGTN